MLSSLSPARRRLVAAAAAVAAAGVLIVAFVVVRGAVGGSGAPRAVAQDRPGPVVLVPGYGGATGGLTRLAETLRANGHATVRVMPLPGGGTGDLRTQAGDLRRTVMQLRAQSPGSSVDVVGYSAGGVVARLWARDYGGAAVARRIVTLGSPHHGTDLAATAGQVLPGACPTACRQLEPDSDLLRQLNRGDETPAGPRWVSIWSSVDQVVTPPDSARLSGATDIVAQQVCSDSRVAHGDLPTDTLVAGLVVRALAASVPTQPSSRDCGTVRALATR